MAISAIDESQRNAAKVAGIAYLLSFAMVVSAFYGIYARLVVPGNTAEAARNIIAHERLFRIVIACDVLYGAGTVAVLTALYVILRPVNRVLAVLAAFSRLVWALMYLVIPLNLFYVLRLLRGADYVRGLEAERLQALVRLHLAAGFDAYYVGLLFWGLASTICSYLWLKSNYIPRFLAVWGVLSSAWAAVCALVFFIFPGFGQAVNLYSFDTPLGLFELATSFWLVFQGLKPSGVAAAGKTSI
ncbi:MAG TPA: DUF4386 domain-containing protein [Candidatus Acidoferrum sp.]|nr:DUF4386 domain-containing protein [Candidatus Acidoferrum sp.]